MLNLVSKQRAAGLVGLHPEYLMRMVRQGRFPKPIRFGPNDRFAVRFVETEVQEWIEARIAERDANEKEIMI